MSPGLTIAWGSTVARWLPWPPRLATQLSSRQHSSWYLAPPLATRPSLPTNITANTMLFMLWIELLKADWQVEPSWPPLS